MGGGTKVIIGLIMIAVLMIVFPIVMSATHDLQTDPYNHVEADVTTGAGETTADVVLTYALWNDDVGSVLSIASTEATDTPAVGSYAAATKTLTVTGLVESKTRDLTIQEEHDALTSFTGMGPLVGITPLLIWIAILATVIAGTWLAFKSRNA